jgi:hypothetical protein
VVRWLSGSVVQCLGGSVLKRFGSWLVRQLEVRRLGRAGAGAPWERGSDDEPRYIYFCFLSG